MNFTFDLDIFTQCLTIWSQFTCFRNLEGKLSEFEGFPDISEETAERYRALAQETYMVSGKIAPRVTVDALDFVQFMRSPDFRAAIRQEMSIRGIRPALIHPSRHLYRYGFEE